MNNVRLFLFSIYPLHTIHSSCSIVSTKKYCKSSNNMSISLPIAEWLEGHAGKQGVAGSIPGGGIYYYFRIFANGTLFTSRRRPYKWNQAWQFIQSNGSTEIDLILKQIWRRFIWRQVSFKPSFKHIHGQQTNCRKRAPISYSLC